MMSKGNVKKAFSHFMLMMICELGFSAYAYNPQNMPESSASMKPSDEVPAQIRDVGITEKLGDFINLNLPVTDELGAPKLLRDYYEPNRPTLVSLVYFDCPNLCNLHLNAVVEGLKSTGLTPGKDYELIALSFEPKETYQLAYAKKQNYVKLYGDEVAQNGFHFLVAPAMTSTSVASSIGFKYKWDAHIQQWAHASATVVTSPEGKISRYWHGMMMEPKDMKLSMQEASAGKVGNLIDRMIWFCYHYDTRQSKYVIYAMRLVQLGGIIMICLLGFVLLRRKFQW